MRVLFCTFDYHPRAAGGAEHQARLQAEELARRGHQVEVVCPRLGSERSGRVGPVYVHRVPRADRRPFKTATALISLYRFLRRRAGDFDVVHVHLASLQTDVAALACRRFGTPLYVKIAAGGPRGEIGKLRRVALVTRYWGLRQAACAQAISGEIAAQLAEVGVEERRIAAIPNGYDPREFRPATADERRELRERLGIPPDARVVLYLGRFAGYKGLSDLLAAWPRAARDRSDLLLLVGSVAFDDPFEMPDLPPSVRVLPWSTRPSELYRAADVFVQPSYVEGMSNALLEAMACGLAVVATSVGAAPEMVRDGSAGVLVAPGDVGAIAAGIGGLLDDPERRAGLGAAAAASVASRYSIESVVDRIEARYREIVAARSQIAIAHESG